MSKKNEIKIKIKTKTHPTNPFFHLLLVLRKIALLTICQKFAKNLPKICQKFADYRQICRFPVDLPSTGRFADLPEIFLDFSFFFALRKRKECESVQEWETSPPLLVGIPRNKRLGRLIGMMILRERSWVVLWFVVGRRRGGWGGGGGGGGVCCCCFFMFIASLTCFFFFVGS